MPLIVAPALVWACGEGEKTRTETLTEERRAVSAVLHQYVSAVAHDDFEKACSFLTRKARAGFRDSGRGQVGTPTCAAGIKVFFDASYTPQEAAKYRVREVEITGDRAVATPDNEDQPKAMLRRVDGKWLIAGTAADQGDTYPPTKESAESVVRDAHRRIDPTRQVTDLACKPEGKGWRCDYRLDGEACTVELDPRDEGGYLCRRPSTNPTR